MREAVVFVHGVWMTGLEMTRLRRLVAAHGFACRSFFYHSLSATPQQSALRLHDFLARADAEVVHLVAHSLGGIVVLHLFEQAPLQKPGRVVMLGTPINGSAIAQRLYRQRPTRPLLGRSVVRGLLGDAPRWRGGRELAMIAGSRGPGVSKLVFGGLDAPNDGTVALRETRSPEVTVHLTVPYSHLGMLWSTAVAEAVGRFLRTGALEP